MTDETGETDDTGAVGGAEPEVPIHCPACETTTRVPLSEVGGTAERHNEGIHGGEDVARVDPDLADRLADIVAEELGLL